MCLFGVDLGVKVALLDYRCVVGPLTILVGPVNGKRYALVAQRV